MAERSCVVWFGASGFEVLGFTDDGVEVTVEVETTATVVGCAGCGTRAKAKDRRWVTARDAPLADRQVRLRWRKRIWSCPELDCEVRTWTETAGLAEPRRVLTVRAATWATDRVAAVDATPASVARGFAVAWSTVWTAITRIAQTRVDDAARVGESNLAAGAARQAPQRTLRARRRPRSRSPR